MQQAIFQHINHKQLINRRKKLFGDNQIENHFFMNYFFLNLAS